MKFLISIAIIFFILLITLAFGINNEQIVSVNYLIAQGEIRLSSLLSIAMGFGFLFSSILFGYVFLKQKLTIKLQQHKIKKLTAENAQ